MQTNLILCIESSSSICGVAVVEKGIILSLVEEQIHRKHAEILPGFIQQALEKSGKTISQLNAISISIGPGSFTGLRIGLGMAKGLAFSQDLPIIPVPTLASMAFGLGKSKPIKGLSYSHGKRVFYQEFTWDDNLPVFTDKPKVGDIDDFIEKIDSSTFQWNCDSVLPKSTRWIETKPSAKNVGLLSYYRQNEWLIEKPYDLVPEYIAPFAIHTKE